MKNKIILLVEIPSACGGNAYVLVDEMIQRGFRYLPMVTTEKDSQNITNSEATYIDTDKFQILLLKKQIPLYGENNGIYWGITNDIIENCTRDTGKKYFTRLNLDKALQLKKEDPSSFAIVCIFEYVNIHTPLPVYDIDMYISGTSISKADIDRRLALIDELVTADFFCEYNRDENSVTPTEEIIDALYYNKEPEKNLSVEASNIVMEAMLGQKLKEFNTPYSFKMLGKKSIYKLQIDKNISACFDMLHHGNETSLSVEIYLEERLPFYEDPKKMDALYSLLNQINTSYFSESVCAIYNLGVLAVINFPSFCPQHSTDKLDNIIKRTYDLIEDLIDIRNFLRGTTTLEEEMKKRNVWMRKL